MIWRAWKYWSMHVSAENKKLGVNLLQPQLAQNIKPITLMKECHGPDTKKVICCNFEIVFPVLVFPHFPMSLFYVDYTSIYKSTSIGFSKVQSFCLSVPISHTSIVIKFKSLCYCRIQFPIQIKLFIKNGILFHMSENIIVA